MPGKDVKAAFAILQLHWMNHTESYAIGYRVCLGSASRIRIQERETTITEPELAYYNQRKCTLVSADASSYGICGVIIHVDKPIALSSRV